MKLLFCEKQAVPAQAAGRIQRWALILANYEYKILFRPTHKHSNADALSRLPSSTTSVEEPVPTELILLMEAIEKMPITGESIKDWTQKDPTLSRIYKYIQNGWPNQCPEELKQFVRWKLELSTLNGCILFGSRVLVPPPGRKQLLLELHQTREEAAIVGVTPELPLKPWSWPSKPWNRLHIDYVGPFMNSMFLLIIDAHSKWVEIFKTSSTTSAATIQLSRSTFARFGIPQTIVSDNGSCFTSSEFEEFLKLNGITHLLTALYHLQSNGLAERMVQAFKGGMKKLSEGTIDLKLARFLFNYRIMPHSTTGMSPSELMFGRQLHTRFDLLQPQLNSKVFKKQQKQSNHLIDILKIEILLLVILCMYAASQKRVMLNGYLVLL